MQTRNSPQLKQRILVELGKHFFIIVKIKDISVYESQSKGALLARNNVYSKGCIAMSTGKGIKIPWFDKSLKNIYFLVKLLSGKKKVPKF